MERRAHPGPQPISVAGSGAVTSRRWAEPGKPDVLFETMKRTVAPRRVIGSEEVSCRALRFMEPEQPRVTPREGLVP